VFLSLAKLSFIVGTILPFFFSVPIFQVIDPRAHILRPVFMIVNAMPIGSIVQELSFVKIPIEMIEGPPSVRLPIQPLTFVFSTVFPFLTAESVLNQLLGRTTTFCERCKNFAHLTRIANAIWHCNVFNFNQLRII
jgi:hypothetical protein